MLPVNKVRYGCRVKTVRIRTIPVRLFIMICPISKTQSSFFFTNKQFICVAQQTRSVILDEAKKAIAWSNESYFQVFAKGGHRPVSGVLCAGMLDHATQCPADCGLDVAFAFFKTAYHKFGLRNGRLITVDIFGLKMFRDSFNCDRDVQL